MKPKKMHLLITLFLAFWVLFILWGIFKTSLKLSPPRQPPAQKTGKPEATAKKTDTSALSRTEKKNGKTTPAPAKKAIIKDILTKEAQQPAPEPIAPKPEVILTQARTLKVKATDFQDILPAMGTIKGETEIEIRFETNGMIKNIYFQEGERVKKGSLVASLDPKDAGLRLRYAENKLGSAQAAYNSAQKRAEVAKKLFEAGALIKSKLEEIELDVESNRFQVETARSEMEITKNELDKTLVYANKDYVMGPREAEEGEFATTQDKIGSLLEITNVFIDVGIVERDIDKVKLGQRAKIYVDAYPDITFQGAVERIFPMVEGKSRTLTVKIKSPNPEGILLPGMFSRAEINICELKNAIIIPSTCLVNAGSGVTLVPVVLAQTIETGPEELKTGIVQLRRVTLGYITSDYAQITEGLSPGDLVILEAQGELKDNIKVKIVSTEELSI